MGVSFIYFCTAPQPAAALRGGLRKKPEEESPAILPR